MKTIVLTVLIGVIALVSCGPRPAANSELVSAGRRRTREVSLDEPSAAREIEYDSHASSSALVDPGGEVIAVYGVHLDLDASEEQVLLIAGDETGDPVRLVVASFDSLSEGYTIAFEAESLSTRGESSELMFEDMVGDHSIEIISRGVNESGEHTIDVFRKSASPTGFGLFYESILSIAVDGAVEVERPARSEDYRVGIANGASYFVKTLTTPERSENLLDLDLVRYAWKFDERRYVRGQEERISGSAVEQIQLEELFRSNAAAFERYLDGVWLRELPATVEESYLVFEPDLLRFTYFAVDVQEVYEWRASYKTLVNQVEISGVNELIPYIRKIIYVRVDSPEVVRLLGSDAWAGTYRRVGDRNPETGAREDIASVTLSGRFVSDIGDVITFTDSGFTIDRGDETEDGVFSLYQLGVTILELRVREPTGVYKDALRFAVEYSETIQNERLLRTLLLTPGIVGMYGFEPTVEAGTRYEILEELSKLRA